MLRAFLSFIFNNGLLFISVEKVTEAPSVVPPPLLPPSMMFRRVFPEPFVNLKPGEEFAIQCLPKNLNAKLTW